MAMLDEILLGKKITCDLCGKEARVNDLLSMANIGKEYTAMAATNTLCPACTEGMRTAYKVAHLHDYIGRNYPDSSLRDMLDDYSSHHRESLLEDRQRIINPSFKGVVEEILENAEKHCYQYYSFADIIAQTEERIRKESAVLPAPVIDAGAATFACDKDTLYCMANGRAFVSVSNLSAIKDCRSRLEVADYVTDNVLAPSQIINRIPIQNIEYYLEKGDISFSTSVSGGGGGKANIKGAVVGGLLFGTAGALVGSHTGKDARIQSVSSEAVEHDMRYVVLRYRDANNKIVDEEWDYACYAAFSELIPEKEYSYVQLHSANQQPAPKANQAPGEGSIPFDELVKLKQLLDMGVITQEDFEATKKKLLGI